MCGTGHCGTGHCGTGHFCICLKTEASYNDTQGLEVTSYMSNSYIIKLEIRIVFHYSY